VMVAAAALTLVIAILAAFALDSMIVLQLGAAAAVGLSVVGMVRALLWLRRARGPASEIVVGLVAFLLSAFGALVAITMLAGFTRGRQVRRAGRVLLPKLRGGRAWTHVALAVTAPAELRAPLAARWRENGRTEHASVAAFARLTLDLIALGAPPALVAAANQDALDEIRHAELCFSLARALDGAHVEPAPFPEPQRARPLPRQRTLALARLAVDSLVDGALQEGISARVIARLARDCPEPAVRALLKELAADEGRHAAHGWDVVQWCLTEGGTPVAHALRGALPALPAEITSSATVAWERWGLAGADLEREESRAARAQIVGRVERLIG
jgi:hypothetical protein